MPKRTAASYTYVLLSLSLLAMLFPARPGMTSVNGTTSERNRPSAAADARRTTAGARVGRWTWQNPLPQGNNLRSVYFVNVQAGWAVGDGGTILRTVDGGAAWVLQPSGTTAWLNSVFFADSQTGWAVGTDWSSGDGDGVILKTNNGGANWFTQLSLDNPLFSVNFVDRQTGWAVGSHIILKTTDGGATWARQDVGPLSARFHSVDFVDANTGWIVGQSLTILKTTNGGATWTSQSSGISGGPYHLFSASFVNATTGWVVGGWVLKTSDGGASWAPQSTPAGQSPDAVTFVNESTGWVVGSAGLIAKSTNGGTTWTAQPSGISDAGAYFRSIACVNTQSCWAVGDYGTIVKTADGGTTWTPQSNGTKEIMRSVAFADARTGWAVGDSTSPILKTDNGGRTWLPQAADVHYNDLFAVASLDVRTAWAVGESGIILKTDNGGVNWVSQPSGTKAIFFDVEFVSSQVGWTVGGGWPVGESGIALKTSDSGATWSQQTVGSVGTLYSVAFVDFQTGWAVGKFGSILKTIDGGTSWGIQTSGTSNDLYSVSFVDANTGWVVGEAGTILKTTDGGASWTPQASGTTAWLESVAFVDANTGWAVGDSGTILKTTNGGGTWTRQDSGTSNDLHAVFFADANGGWAAGVGGTIIGYSSEENRAPSAFLDSISPTAAEHGQTVSFRGYGTDTDLGDVIQAYNWRSSLDGQLSTSASFTKSNLSTGTHIIYFKVQDSNGEWSTEVSRSLLVSPPSNNPPTAVIDSVSPNPAVAGQNVSFFGHGSDPDPGDIVQGYVWRSSVNGQLSTSASFAMANLSVGTHTLYFKVQDTRGTWSEEVSRILVVQPSQKSNMPPTAGIQSIGPNPAQQGEVIAFTGYGIDADGDPITAFVWRSNIDGQLGTAASFSRTNLSVGTHIIYLKVQDSRGAWSEEVGQALVVNRQPTTPPEATFSVGGRIRDTNGNPVVGVSISAGAMTNVTTDPGGYYKVDGLKTGRYTLTPTKSGFVFLPMTRTVFVSQDGSGQDFIALVGTEDSDGDGLLNVWEVNGHDSDGDGIIDVPLPEMGANPLKKDIFVEVDYMVKYEPCPSGPCVGLSHRPKGGAVAQVVQAFEQAPVANSDGSTGIVLHVDYGPDAVMNPVTGAKWGELSRSDAIPHRDTLQPTNEKWDWSEFDRLKNRQGFFDSARARIFHYALFSHDLGGNVEISTSGMSRNGGGDAFRKGASDFVVSLGQWTDSVGTELQQAGTFMHELGHNLGLRHGGDDHRSFEPNYLSVMNYAFQTRGLILDGQDGALDYSRFASIPALNENHLNELLGLDGTSATSRYGTRYYCNQENQRVLYANLPIDWDCSGGLSGDVSANIDDANGHPTNSSLETLTGAFDDWSSLVYDGDSIGPDAANSAAAVPSDQETSTELTFQIDKRIYTPYKIAVSGGGDILASPGTTSVRVITVTNSGVLTGTASMSYVASQRWFDLSAMPLSGSLAPSGSFSFPITLSVPIAGSAVISDSVMISATIQEAPRIRDSAVLNARGGVLAQYHAEPVGGTKPVVVRFTDSSVGQIASWLWDFGDGLTSTLRSPTHTYTASGTYTVTLTISGPDGGDSKSRVAFVRVADESKLFLPILGKESSGGW